MSALQDAQVVQEAQGVDELMLIGGTQLYEQALPLAERLYLTRIALAPAYAFEHWQRRGWVRRGEVPAVRSTFRTFE